MTFARLREAQPSAPIAPIAHGGRLDEARRCFPEARTPWIDLSTGVSPYPYPLPAIPAGAWTRLPDEDALARLESAARLAYSAPAHVELVAGAGTQSFIQWLPRLIPARRVATLGFTYAEHAAAWRESGAEVDFMAALEDLAGADVAVVVNPNNPDGRMIEPGRLADLARRMGERGKLLVVDEAFMDFSPDCSLAALAPQRGLVLLRSFGKAYGLPGLRLGFALCGPDMGMRLRAALGPWSVSGPALAVGAVALADGAWLATQGARLRDDTLRLDALLGAAGFEILGGAKLFRLAASDRAGEWFRRLAQNGILTRRFPEQPRWLRFGIPGDEGAWARFAQACGRHE